MAYCGTLSAAWSVLGSHPVTDHFLQRLFCRRRTVLLSVTKWASRAHVLEENCTNHILVIKLFV